MAEIKIGEPFGMDAKLVSEIDWDLALARVVHDLRSDFVYAPHLGFLYRKAGKEAVELLTNELKAGTYSPGVPITIEVPKPFRIAVKVKSKRLGPNYSRPGSILLPRDRLLYQALADEAASVVQAKTDFKRVFSHALGPAHDPSMFLPTRECWNALQKALSTYGKPKSTKYVLKIDVANFFGSLNQHTLINVLSDSGYPKSLLSRLEAILVRYTGERSSRGILQGMYPSDLLGNFYLAPIDRFLGDFGVSSARYVDDVYIFLESVDQADRLLRKLIPTLRSYDLVLNEAKSVIMPKAALFAEEPDLEALFADAVAEIASQLETKDFDADYGFQSEWNEEPDDQEELELEATKALFDSLSEYPGNEENIERFCLPLFSKAASDYAVPHVLEAIRKRPSMAQIYSAYIAKFLDNADVVNNLRECLIDEALLDWQKMWMLAALSQVSKADDDLVKVAFLILQDANKHDALRAVAAMYVGRFGDHARRKALVATYAVVSNYIQAAIYYSSRQWPSIERSNAKASWSGHGPLHNLLTIGMGKK
jgi:hypothetical protein